MKVEARLAVLTGEVHPPLFVVEAKNGEEWTAIGSFTSDSNRTWSSTNS